MDFKNGINRFLRRDKVKIVSVTDPVFEKQPQIPGQIGNQSGERVVQGLDEDTSKKVLTSLLNKEKINDKESWFDYLNNPDLFYPKGVRLLPNPENLPPIELLKKPAQLASAGMLAMTILTTLDVTEVQAQNNAASKEITWALEAFEKIDPINYIINRKNNKKSLEHNGFSEEDKKILTWNLYHEVRGDKEDQGAGIYGVLLSTLERMKSKKYSAEQVVFQEYQYSWTNDILSGKINSKIDVKSYTKLREIVEQFTTGKSIDINITQIKAQIMKMTGRTEIPTITHYHRYGMLDDPRLKVQAGEKTRKRIQELERRYTLNPNGKDIIKLGKHIFYFQR